MVDLAPAPASAAGLSGTEGVFKVVKPPKRGARKRLTIHSVRRGLPPGVSARSSARHTWFWPDGRAALSAADPARLAGLAKAAEARLGGKAEAALIAKVAASFPKELSAAAARAGVSEALLAAVVAAESAGNPRAVSPAGAQGLAQLMPGTAARFNVSDAFDPSQNLRGSADYLSLLLKMFDEDAVLALAGYNAGENAVTRNDGVPPYAETRDYVPIVLTYYALARKLCAKAPAGPRDRCAFPAR